MQVGVAFRLQFIQFGMPTHLVVRRYHLVNLREGESCSLVWILRPSYVHCHDTRLDEKTRAICNAAGAINDRFSTDAVRRESKDLSHRSIRRRLGDTFRDRGVACYLWYLVRMAVCEKAGC